MNSIAGALYNLVIFDNNGSKGRLTFAGFFNSQMHKSFRIHGALIGVWV
jgi:hypothetical protein